MSDTRDRDDNDDDPEIPLEMKAALDELEQVAFKLGLYMMGVSVTTPSDERGPIKGAEVYVAAFQIGNNAFHPRVQDPESDHFDTQSRIMESGEREADMKRISDEIMKRIRAGEHPLGGTTAETIEDEDDDQTPDH